MSERQSELATEMCNSWLLASCGSLPGADIVAAGLDALADLASGERREFTVEALLVAVGARRLRAAGLQVPDAPGWPETRNWPSTRPSAPLIHKTRTPATTRSSAAWSALSEPLSSAHLAAEASTYD